MKTSLVLAKKGPNVATIHPELTIRDAIGVLAMHNIGSLVVMDDNRRPVGILEEHDIIRRAASDEAPDRLALPSGQRGWLPARSVQTVSKVWPITTSCANLATWARARGVSPASSAAWAR